MTHKTKEQHLTNFEQLVHAIGSAIADKAIFYSDVIRHHENPPSAVIHASLDSREYLVLIQPTALAENDEEHDDQPVNIDPVPGTENLEDIS